MRVHFIHRRLIILTLVIICQCCTGCMDSGTENNNSFSGIKESRSNVKGPLILFEKTVHDFGKGERCRSRVGQG